MLQPDSSNTEVFLTHGYFLHEDPREKNIMKPYPPLGLLYISAWLEKHDVANEVFDSTFSDFDALCSALLKKKPRIIGIYTNLMTKLNVLRIIQFVRTKAELEQSRIILGGPEVRHHADNFLKHGAHFIVIGEGEDSMLELCRYILSNVAEKNSDGDRSALQQIRGIAFRNEAMELIRTGERDLKKDPDQLPFPNRKKINLNLYLNAWKQKHGKSAVSVSTMRGCPYTCKWCSRAVYGQSYRRRSPASVVAEIRELQRAYAFDTIWFVDDVFTISHKWLREFREEIQKQDIHLSYECISRADRMNASVIEDLKASGCFRVWIGAESGSQKILDAMDRRVKAIQVREMIQLSGQAGIETGTFIMVGYPGETQDDLEQTLKHLILAKPDHYTITLAYPITGTDLFSETKSLFKKQVDWVASTDRDIDFRRTYHRRYYDYAIRRIHNEVAYHKSRSGKKDSLIKSGIYKLKSVAAKTIMTLYRLS